MSAPDFQHLTAAQAVRDLRAGRYSAEQLVLACQARIDRFNPTLNALVTLNREGALAAARGADRRLAQGGLAPALLGVPVSIKDAFATRDMLTTASHRPLAAYRPGADATVVARWREAGAVLMGKSNLPELAGAPHCWSPLFGLTRNPWNPALTPGGSSGGAAVAVAAGFSLLDIGSDIAGSIRIPAAYCGIAGLKATENRIPRTGHIPHLPPEFGGPGRSVWHMLAFGVLARSVEDLQLGYGLLAGPDGVDCTVPPFLPEPPSLPTTARAVAPMRIALWDDFAGMPLCPRIRRGLQNMAGKLRASGHEVVRCAPADFDVGAAWHAFGLIGGAEIGLGMPGWQRRLFLALRPLLPRDHVITRAVAAGMRFDLRRYNQALNQREGLIRSLERFVGEWDAVICPVAPTGPYPGEPMPPTRKPPRLNVGEATLPYLEATIAMTAPFSLTGSPVLSLPVGIEDGLPVGVQVIGKRWQEHALLETGRRLENALGGFVPPPLAA
ncbi:amidase [Azoarcus olearius]|uniref:Probable amidase n=1 Tax=Azoarcus sp. (strain BH72) TaxID=418699 RepID=A1K819_AZOSB|nr:amidase [Azoarcus olearius]CAL94974.1 probable amidase [Azoarcus olearius]